MRLSVSLILVLLLFGCGGGSDSSEEAASSTPPASSAPDTEEPLTPAQAARLLNQATFGPRPQDIDSLVDMGAEQWIDNQLDMPPSYHLPKLQQIEASLENPDDLWRQHRLMAWWDRALHGDDQLRQRVAFALSEIFVISEQSSFGHDIHGMTGYYDLLLEHAFANYRDLLEAVTLSPIMGMYLSMLGNEKPDPERNIRPDENYAREVMQLFSIGLTQLNTDGSVKTGADNKPLPTYSQADIEGLAHVFTGWHFAGTTESTWWQWWDNYDAIAPMTAVQAFHDQQEKRIVNDTIIAGGQSAEEALDQALDTLANHPNVGPFIAYRLIQRLVTSNPTSDYVQRVAAVFADNGRGERGDLAAVVKSILLDPEARQGHETQPQRFGKLREPLLRVTHLWRALGGYSTADEYHFGYPDYALNQAPLAAPSVFNFFSPDYSPPGPVAKQNLVAPEFQITTETYAIRTINFVAYSTLWGHHGVESDTDPDEQRILLDLTDEIALLDEPDSLLDHLDLVLMSGQMDDATRQALSDYLTQTSHHEAVDRVANVIFLLVNSPQYMVQK